MTAGGAQTALKAQGLLPAGRTVIAGTGPLLWLLAAQILRAGGKIESILDTTPRGNWLRALLHLPDFMLSPYFAKGLKLLREVRARAPVVRADRIEAVGKDRLSEVVFGQGDGERRIAADLLLLHQGVVPNVNIAIAAGARHAWNERQLCFQPVLDVDFGSSVPGIAVAGDRAGIPRRTAAGGRGRTAPPSAARAPQAHSARAHAA